MSALLKSDFKWRFAGGFALGAVFVAGTQLVGWASALAHIA